MKTKHIYLEKFGGIKHQLKNVPVLINNLKNERAKIESQLDWALAIDDDTSRLENNLSEISDCIMDLESWAREEALI